jgi:hypothetical protein
MSPVHDDPSPFPLYELDEIAENQRKNRKWDLSKYVLRLQKVQATSKSLGGL